MRQTKFFNPEQSWILTSPSWVRCERLIKAFEEAWRQGQAPAIHSYLRASGLERNALLVELVHVDLEFRLKSGESASVETYLRTYSELAADRHTTLELIAAEYELRQLYQGGVGVDEYARRFPEYLEELLERVPSKERETRDLSRHAKPKIALVWPTVPGYEIIAEIGRGGMGVVYQARDPSLGRNVALKFLPADYAHDPERLERFLREARTASALNHPHICTVHALGEYEKRPFIVMEFIEGHTLQELIIRRPGLEEVAQLVGQVARALAAAHAAGVVHRDIKPENIMVREDGYVKVLDFGLARRLPTLAQSGPGEVPDTDPGVLLGTVAYMSPEQARGATADSASDVFALGIVLYQLTTGQHPFEADSSLGILLAIATQQPVPASRLAPEIPASLQGLIEAMLHKDARLRPTAAEVESALTALGGRAAQPALATAPRLIVHRELELTALRAALVAADTGHGSLICVAGEPGIGKTTLVEDFIDALAASDGAHLVARGHCSERLADTEAYLPVIDALVSLLRGEASGSVARLMQVVAPTWYAQIAPLTREGGPAAAVETPRAFSQQAMLREFCDLLREASRLGPIVLFFDDVHWADVSTVDLLAHVGRHSQGLRVLVVLTYRPTEMLLGQHPFHGVKQELQAKGVCTELFLRFLDRQEIDRYLSLAFPGHAFPSDFADLVHSRTEGSPLFMVDLLRYLRERGVVAESGGHWSLSRELPDLQQELPESVRSVIQRKLERLGQRDMRLLAAASVQGNEFDSAVVAGSLNLDAADVEERLQLLDRVHGLVRLVREYEFPDRTLTLRYAFVHILYQQSLYTDLPPTRRAALSVAVATALEGHFGDGSAVVAAALAYLYEVGRDFGRAARHFYLAAQNAARVFAHQEAVVLARRGLSRLDALPDTSERAVLELPLQTTLGLQLQVIKGYAAPEAKQAYTRARELCQRVGGTAELFPVLWGLWLFHKVRSELPKAQEMAEELLALARELNDPDLALQVHQALGMTAFCRGRPDASLWHVAQATALYNPNHHRTHSFRFGQDPGVICKSYGSVVLWLLGFPEAAQLQSDEAIRMSQGLSPTSQALALHFAAMLCQLLRDTQGTRKHAEAAGAIAAEHGLLFWQAGAAVMRGWALAASSEAAEGIALLRRGILDWQATGSGTYQTYYLGLLAEALCGHRQSEESERVLKQALTLARQTEEGLYEAELHRLRGELLLRRTPAPGRATRQRTEEDFRRALYLARRQTAKSLELRSAMSLARLGQRFGNQEARELLTETYGWFTEGLQTPDLQEARGLLESMT